MKFNKNNLTIKLITACILFAATIFKVVYAQHQANLWYFGHQAGISFNDTPPSPLDNSKVKSAASASIADSTGKLLFYTDGNRVWNRQHRIMANGNRITSVKNTFVTENGTQGDTSYNSLKKPYIVPQPGNNANYYIFTNVPQEGYPVRYKLEYALVDMEKQNGLGKVVKKSRELLSSAIAIYEAIRHANGEDTWLVTHPLNSEKFYSYKITEKGLVDQPVKSEMPDSFYCKSYACKMVLSNLCSSPSGNFLAYSKIGIHGQGIKLYHFNRSNGKVSFIDEDSYEGFGAPQDVAFSPDGAYLYTRTLGGLFYQYPIEKNSCNILETELGEKLKIGKGFGNDLHSLQLAPNGKLYYAKPRQKRYLGIIHNPKREGLSCGFDSSGLPLKKGTYGSVLPQFPHWMLPQEVIRVRGPCLQDSTRLSIPPQPFDSVKWHIPAVNRKGEGRTFYPDFRNTGQYRVQAYIYRNKGMDTFSREVCIRQKVPVNLGPDTSVCKGDPLILSLPDSGHLTYHWQDGSKKPAYTVESKGRYSVTISNGNCRSRDTIRVNYRPEPKSSLMNDTSLCPGNSLHLNAGEEGIAYQWSNGAKGTETTVHRPDTYWVKIRGANGCQKTDTVDVKPWCKPVIHVPNAFTPYKKDGVNDVFKPVTKYVTFFKMTIYNRWGEKLFETRDKDRGWNGMYKGELAKPGVYIYKIHYKGKHTNKAVSGDLTLLK